MSCYFSGRDFDEESAFIMKKKKINHILWQTRKKRKTIRMTRKS